MNWLFVKHYCLFLFAWSQHTPYTYLLVKRTILSLLSTKTTTISRDKAEENCCCQGANKLTNQQKSSLIFHWFCQDQNLISFWKSMHFGGFNLSLLMRDAEICVQAFKRLSEKLWRGTVLSTLYTRHSCHCRLRKMFSLRQTRKLNWYLLIYVYV